MHARWRILCCAALAVVPVVVAARASSAPKRRVEVVDVAGIIDGSTERSVTATLNAAREEHAALVVLQIDSRGVVDAARTKRLSRRIATTSVPVATWVGPAGAHAEHGAAAIALSGGIRAMAPGATIGPVKTLDLRSERPEDIRNVLIRGNLFDRAQSVRALERNHIVDHVVPTLADLLDELKIDSDGTIVRFHKPDLFGRVLHAAAQPSIVYLLLLLGFVGIVFEVFHPSTGPAGVSGLVSLALALQGLVVLGGSWLAVAILAVAMVAFAVDLRFQSLGVFTALGFAGLVAGSLLLFRGPFLRVSPWILALGIIGMTLFLLGAMTRVLRDLRAVARGDLQVQDAHPHAEGGH